MDKRNRSRGHLSTDHCSALSTHDDVGGTRMDQTVPALLPGGRGEPPRSRVSGAAGLQLQNDK